jgi:hypothetical protein
LSCSRRFCAFATFSRSTPSPAPLSFPFLGPAARPRSAGVSLHFPHLSLVLPRVHRVCFSFRGRLVPSPLALGLDYLRQQ